ncbi:acyloxyacyl hydrolase [Mangrovimonas futianensis]|uniref:acyloxyacyl hydrolase n=1 Tax=Mangrovimonas futianensis TaxID=2895523 RepID=UPI001E4C50B2|nr:acyloxyacyl hydrolase [Mangrovimonas futianensis]MCF1421138.1 acyloxyacyl hydrolase [Mangrovimonas futianensis]
MKLLRLLLFCPFLILAQTPNTSYLTPEIQLGKTLEANDGFPNTQLQKSFFLSWGNYNNHRDQEWVYRLNQPKTGVTLGLIDFGNSEAIGTGLSAMTFIDFSLNKSKKLRLKMGLGASYFNKQYDSIHNPMNRAISTNFTWSFNSFLYYHIHQSENIDYNLGLGYYHHSNGHTKLPNQGLNSLLVSFSGDIRWQHINQTEEPITNDFKRNSYRYFSSAFGLGWNTLSNKFNSTKNVYNLTLSYGKVINRTFKFGFGAYYRFYEHYYDYIKNEETLILEEYPQFKDNPYGYATNIGLLGKGELLLNHFGLEFQIGLNIYKPFYSIDWKLNQGYTYERPTENGPITVEVLGELDWYYEVKRTISSKMGINYYFIGTDKTPKHNFFIGAHINANLGQADFTEFSAGYVYSFHFRK